MLPCGGQWKPTLLQQGGLARALCERGFKHQWVFSSLEYYAERSSSNRQLRMVIHGVPDLFSCTALNNDNGHARKLPIKGPVDHLLAGPVAARKGALGRHEQGESRRGRGRGRGRRVAQVGVLQEVNTHVYFVAAIMLIILINLMS